MLRNPSAPSRPKFQPTPQLLYTHDTKPEQSKEVDGLLLPQTYLKTELKLSLRDMNMVIFAIIMPLVIFIILGIIYGTKPAYDGADYTFMEQSFGAVSAVAICASGDLWVCRWQYQAFER